MKITPDSKIEYLIVAIIFGAIMFPVRILIISIFGNNWYMSFVILVTITITIITLSKKNKLGFFGPMYIRFITRLHKAKIRLLAYSITGMFLITSTSIIILTTEGHNGSNFWTVEIERQIFENGDPTKDLKYNTLDTKLSPILLPTDRLPTEYQLVSSLFAIVDDSTKGWFLHFYTVMFIEQAELTLMLVITKIAVMRNKI